MRQDLLNYDIFPKVFPVGKEMNITVRPRGGHAAFTAEKEYTVEILTQREGRHGAYPNRDNLTVYHLTPAEDGCIHITHTFPYECEYYVRVYLDERRSFYLAVFAVLPDLVGRYPYMGDLHMHTTKSDGKEHPFIVAANYRRFGYDFMAITDHRRFYPSLETKAFYEPLGLDVKFYTGEEIHLPGNDVHIVNFGGDYSINGLVESSDQFKERGEDKKWRSLDGECPPVMTVEQYDAEVTALAETLDIPDDVEKFTYASCVWISNQIKKANGLGIFAHPYWIYTVFQVPESLTTHLLETHPFDAFEIYGGEMYFEQNGFQEAKYYEMREKGIKLPIVGSTDSHGSTDYNRKYKTARTMVFAKENTRDEIVDSIKNYYNVAIEDLDGEHPHMVGDLRMMRYGWFLFINYFPLHDELCYEEGRLMKEYAGGDMEAGEELRRFGGRTEKLLRKYFKFD